MRVPDTGPYGANILIVGEAPGEEEVKQGVPFVGSAGKLLKHTLRSNGIAFESCYVTNIMDTRPPGNNFIHLLLLKSLQHNGLPFCRVSLRRPLMGIGELG